MAIYSSFSLPLLLLMSVVAMSCGLISGCKEKSTSAKEKKKSAAKAADVKVSDDSSELQELVRQIVRRRPNYDSLQGESTLRFLDQERSFRLTVEADIAAVSPDKLRIVASKAMGKVSVLDLAIVGDDIGVYLPRDKVFYVGKVDELPAVGLDVGPETLMRHILAADYYLGRLNWRQAETDENITGKKSMFRRGQRQERSSSQTSKDSGNLLTLIEVPDPDFPAVELYRIQIKMPEKQLVRVERLNRRGNVMFAKDLQRYKELSTPTGQRFSAAMDMELSWPQERRSVRLEWKQLTPDAKINEDVFMPDVPAKIPEKPLRNAQIQGDTE